MQLVLRTEGTRDPNPDQRLQTPSSHPHHAVFSPAEWPMSARLLRILLQRAGVETNPGPRVVYICPVCKKTLSKGVASVRCTQCNEWCHLKHCSGLSHTKFWNTNFVASCCFPSTIQTQSIPPMTVNYSPYTQTTASPSTLRILQLNCNGLRRRIAEIVRFMEQNSIQIAALQETKLNSTMDLNVPNYTLVREDREKDKGGSIAFLVHSDIKFRTIKLNINHSQLDSMEQQAIAVMSLNSEVTLINVYIPPSSSCPNAYVANISHLLNSDDCIVMGDFNAHHSLWHSAKEDDSRGNDLAEQVDHSHFGILNDDSPTRVTSACVSSPDFTLASPSLLTGIDWKTKVALDSDHIPIIISIPVEITKCKSDRNTYINFLKADWESYNQHTEQKFANIRAPRNVHHAEKTLRTIICKSARLFIPAGSYHEVRPNFPTAAARMADERDTLRETQPGDPRIKILSDEIRHLVNEHKREKWKAHLEKSSFAPGCKSLWQTIKRLSCPQKKVDNVALSFANKTISDDAKCANELNRQFTPHPTYQDKSSRNTVRKIHQLNRTDTVIFTTEQVTNAVKAAKTSKALGPDGISPIMLKHLGPFGIDFITNMLNLSMDSLTIPGVWKVGRVIPLLKPGKPVENSKSYRPISLLSPLAKLLETLILPILKENLKIAYHQHGFRKGHSTVTALHFVINTIQQGLNQRKPNQRTVLVALDLSRAFDTVSHGVLLKDLLNTTVPPTIKRWIANYVRGRQTFVAFREKTSKYRKVKQGVPQGGVLSPILFNFYMSDLPHPPPEVKLVSYADDITLMATNTNVQEACDHLNAYLATLNEWLKSKHLELSAEKSTATIFTTWTREVNTELDIRVAGNLIPTVKRPRILGVTLDNLLSFADYAKQVCGKMQSRNNVLKSLAGTSWGKDKETITTTFKAIGRSILNYAAPVWSSQLSDTSWGKLQVTQNVALRVATGCHLMASQSHIHEETSVIPVKQHNELLSKQYLLRCHLKDHPCHAIVNETLSPRSIKKSLVKVFTNDIAHKLPPDGLDEESYKKGIKELHTEAVHKAVSGYPVNMVLNSRPPRIHSSELHLPRSTRTTLSQLRSGRCRLLNSYMSRLDSSITNTCPDCGNQPHDTNHLFDCPANLTRLNVESLWTKPKEAATFLGLKTAEED